MQQIKIGQISNLSLKQFGGIYLATFGSLWLAIEPLGTFGLLSDVTLDVGWTGYLSLVFISFIFAILISKGWRSIKFNRQEFINIIVESSLEGATYQVKAPMNMQVWDFSRLFIEHLEKGAASEKVHNLKWHYTPILNVRRNDETFALNNSITMKEAKIVEGDCLFITGKPIEVDSTPRFSIASD